LEITLSKSAASKETSKWWKVGVIGDPEIDVQKIEGSQYLDRSLIERLKVMDMCLIMINLLRVYRTNALLTGVQRFFVVDVVLQAQDDAEEEEELRKQQEQQQQEQPTEQPAADKQ
jgi:hypothetical protein